MACQNREDAPLNCTPGGVLHAHEPQVVPDLLQQVVEVPAVVSRDGDAVRHLVDDVELLDGNLINFVEHVNAGDVDPVVRVTVSSCCRALHGGERIRGAFTHLPSVKDTKERGTKSR